MSAPFDVYIEEVAQYRLRVLAPNAEAATALARHGRAGAELLDRTCYVYEVEPVCSDGGAA
jgi:predicted nuclease with RNAse H fold